MFLYLVQVKSDVTYHKAASSIFFFSSFDILVEITRKLLVRFQQRKYCKEKIATH